MFGFVTMMVLVGAGMNSIALAEKNGPRISDALGGLILFGS
jgi:hypothetical protein